MPPVDTTLKGGLAPLARDRPEASRDLAAHGREHVHSAAARRRGAARQRQLRGRRGARFAVAEPDARAASRRSSCARSRSRRAGCSRPERPDQLANDLERQVWIFLSRLKQRGALAGATPDQAFFVRTSAALDPNDGRARRLDRAAHRFRAARAERVPDLRLPLPRLEPHDRGAARPRRRAAPRLSCARSRRRPASR